MISFFQNNLRLTVVLALLLPASAIATTDMKNSNFSETAIDMALTSSGYDLRVRRTYNSRSLHNGIFGFGWCSDFETRLERTPEGNLKTIDCGGGLELIYTPKDFDPKAIDASIGKIMAEVKKRNTDLSPEYLQRLQRDLKANTLLREELGKRLDVLGDVREGVTYFSDGRVNETIVFRESVFVRTLPDGTHHRFDKDGRLTHMHDKNGNFLRMVYEKDRLVAVVDNNGRRLNFAYDPTTHKVARITGPNELSATYETKGENLLGVTNAWGNKYTYTYDDLHNLTRVNYPDNTYKAMSYNKDRDWITSYRDRQGCMESYGYHVNKEDPLNHYWSTVEKKCGDKVTNRSKYEFFHRPRQDGLGTYLYRARSEINESVTDIVYHEVYGKPLSIVRNSQKTDYTYNTMGMVQTKREAFREMAFAYETKCNKVAQVRIRHFAPPQKDKDGKTKEPQVVRTTSTAFTWDHPKCNLTFARNSDGQTARMEYDNRGRIAKIEDHAKRIVKITYEERFGKPATITRPGVGTLSVRYRPDGAVEGVNPEDGGAQVATQVGMMFNSVLEMIGPAIGGTLL